MSDQGHNIAPKGTGSNHTSGHITLTQSDHDIIKSFLSSVPTGFPLSPGAALAELTGFSPLSPSLPQTNYQFSLSPARNIDPPSPSRHGLTVTDTLKQPRVHNSPKRLQTPPRNSLTGFNSPRRVLTSHSSPHRLVARAHSSPESPTPSSPSNPQCFREPFSSPSHHDPPSIPWSPQRFVEPNSSHSFKTSPSRLKQSKVVHTDNTVGSCPPSSRTCGHEESQRYPKRDLEITHNQSDQKFKRPKLSSPSYSPPQRQSIDYSSMLSVGTFSPRRPHFNNPYLPVNPPTPYSPKRQAYASVNSPSRYNSPASAPTNVADQRYPRSTESRNSPSQLTHPPSPRMDLSPSQHIFREDQEDLVLEPLDLDTSVYQYSHDTLKTKSKDRNRSLTQSVKRKLGIDKKLIKKKSPSRSIRDRKAPPHSIPSTVLETNLSEVTSRLKSGCECGMKCFSGLESDFVWKHRCNIAELSKGEHDMYLMGIMMASLANPKATSKHKERQRNRNKYIFQGKEVCQEAFLYLENVTIYQLKSIRRHVLEHGVVARVHKNKGKRPHNVLELDHYQLTHRFVEDLLENQRGGKKKACLTDLTCKNLHLKYVAYFSDLGMGSKKMAYSTFRNFVHQRFPQLKFTSRETVFTDPINSSSSKSSDTILKIETHDFQT